MITTISLFFVFLFSTFAQEKSTDNSTVNSNVNSKVSSVATAAPASAAPKLRMNFSTYYYSFQGERAAITNEYEFDKITSRLDFLNVNYALPANWSVNLLVQHYDSYIETKFPKVTVPEWKQSNDRINGLADTYLTVIAPLKMSYPVILTADFGVSLPTGAIDVKAVNLPGLEQIHLAYNAQLGSGTLDGLLGATLLYLQPNYQLGSRLFGNLRTGRNKYGYRLGDQYRMDAWFDYNFKNGISPRLAGYYRIKQAIDGFDETRGNNPADRYFFSKQANWDISAALRYQKVFKGTQLALNAEAGIPLAQRNINVDNTFVRTLYYVNLGLGAAF